MTYTVVVSTIPVPEISNGIINPSFAVIDNKSYRAFVRSYSVIIGGTGPERRKLIVNAAAASAANACHLSFFSGLA